MKICGFAICGLAHQKIVPICDIGMSPRIFGFAICLRTSTICILYILYPTSDKKSSTPAQLLWLYGYRQKADITRIGVEGRGQQIHKCAYTTVLYISVFPNSWLFQFLTSRLIPEPWLTFFKAQTKPQSALKWDSGQTPLSPYLDLGQNPDWPSSRLRPNPHWAPT